MPFTSETARLAGKKGSRNGIKNQRTKQWAELSESITGGHADNFNRFMNELWEGDKQDRMKAAELFLKTMEFFKPKMSRVMGVVDTEMIIEVRHVESVKR